MVYGCRGQEVPVTSAVFELCVYLCASTLGLVPLGGGAVCLSGKLCVSQPMLTASQPGSQPASQPAWHASDAQVMFVCVVVSATVTIWDTGIKVGYRNQGHCLRRAAVET